MLERFSSASSLAVSSVASQYDVVGNSSACGE